MSILGALGVLFILDKVFGGRPKVPETKEEYRKRYNRMEADIMTTHPGISGCILSVGDPIYLHPDNYNPQEIKTEVGTVIEDFYGFSTNSDLTPTKSTNPPANVR